MRGNIKTCPYCGETVKARAVVCHHCKRNLGTGSQVGKKKSSLLGQLIKVLVIFPLVLVAGISGLALFGIPVALLGAALSFTSRFRRWIVTQRGYAQRLASLPGLRDPTSIWFSVAIIVYLVPLSIACLAILWSSLTMEPENVATMFTFGIFGTLGLYAWFVQGYRLRPTPQRQATAPAATVTETKHFRRISQLDEIKSLDPVAFERFIGSLFERMGYAAQITKVSGDEGVDLVLQRGSRTAVVQCKRYEGTVGKPVVRDLYGTIVHNGADEAYLVTTGLISLPAQQWASDKPIHLMDGTALLEWIESF